MTNIIYLIGRPGTGKYTIAKEIAKAGYVICDNQLVNHPIFELLGYDGFTTIPEFAWDAIGKIRTNIFEFLSQEPDNNYVLTNVLLEDEGDHMLFKQVEQMALKRDSVFFPVKLLISKEENAKRIQNKERLERFKSIDIEDAYHGGGLINIDHYNLLELEVTNLTAQEAAERILKHVEKGN
jgi:hypothetical protein